MGILYDIKVFVMQWSKDYLNSTDNPWSHFWAAVIIGLIVLGFLDLAARTYYYVYVAKKLQFSDILLILGFRLFVWYALFFFNFHLSLWEKFTTLVFWVVVTQGFKTVYIIWDTITQMHYYPPWSSDVRYIF